MDKATFELLAHRAGLAKALAEFPEDVAAAAKQAADVMARIKQPTDPAAEPWPPMRAGTACEGRRFACPPKLQRRRNRAATGSVSSKRRRRSPPRISRRST